MIVNDSVISRYERTNFISKDGYEVAIFSDYWKLNKDIGFFLDHLPEWLDSEIKRAFLQVLSIYAQTVAADRKLTQ
ncbi:MAG: hypothetical protein L0G18_06115 [Pseudomonas sp.]|nr:hypothetical protein [Pseudomonas sp.]